LYGTLGTVTVRKRRKGMTKSISDYGPVTFFEKYVKVMMHFKCASKKQQPSMSVASRLET
jgi:hypothetical protein